MHRRVGNSCYTLVRHSSHVEGTRDAFAMAVEEQAINPDALGDVHRAGGLIFQSYSDAHDTALSENYTTGKYGQGMKVDGTFKNVRSVGAVFIPTPKHRS